MKLCIVEGCASPISARKLCNKHYQQHYQAGSLDAISPNTTRHNLSDVDTNTMLGTCALCGPLTPLIHNGEQLRCIHSKRRPLKYGDKQIPTGVATREYLRLSKLQNNLCAVCGEPEPYGRKLALDHCHTTGKIRGLLCTECNQGIGKLKDRPDILRQAAEYLERAQQPSSGPPSLSDEQSPTQLVSVA
jgi:hypothetical protein